MSWAWRADCLSGMTSLFDFKERTGKTCCLLVPPINVWTGNLGGRGSFYCCNNETWRGCKANPQRDSFGSALRDHMLCSPWDRWVNVTRLVQVLAFAHGDCACQAWLPDRFAIGSVGVKWCRRPQSKTGDVSGMFLWLSKSAQWSDLWKCLSNCSRGLTYISATKLAYPKLTLCTSSGIVTERNLWANTGLESGFPALRMGVNL